jgi:predicted transcriptional regulator
VDLVPGTAAATLCILGVSRTAFMVRDRSASQPALQTAMQPVNSLEPRRWRSMGAVSLRLPTNLEQQLSEEARLSRQPRSQLIREALETLLSQRRHERAQAALKLAAVALASDAGACEETRELAADFLMAENEALAGAEAPVSTASAPVWWR